MKKIIVVLIISIIGVIAFLKFNMNKLEDKNVPKKIKNNLKESEIVSINKRYFSCSIPYISHDDYYDYAKKEIKKMEFSNDEKNNDNNVVIIDENFNENNVVKKNLIDTYNNGDGLEIEDDNQNISENNKEEEKLYEDIINYETNLEEFYKEKVYEIEETIQEENNIETIEKIKSDELISDVSKKSNDEAIVIEEDNSKENIKGYYSPTGKYLGESKVKVIDVSYYQGDINWDLFANEGDCYGVILRLGFYDTLDKKFERNINELKRLNIPYGIYLFSYATTINGSNKESDFTNRMINKYDLKPSLGIYYDIESWSAKNGATSDIITKDMYDNIITNYVNKVSSYVNNEFKVKVYSGRWYAMNRLGDISKSYVDWVAEYNSTCKYDENYSMWQYTSKGNVPGIIGNVDISYLY